MKVSAPSSHAWLHTARRSLARHWVAKTAGITLFNAIFFAGYFYVLNHPASAVTVMPVTALDHWIGFQPFALIPYATLWIYVSLAPGILATPRELLAYGLVAGGVALVGLGAFYFWPTAVPVPAIDWDAHPAFAYLKTIDASGNACPSLHVAFAIFTAHRLHQALGELGAPLAPKIANWAWAAAIVYSTLATKQHVAVDAAAGTVLGWLGGWVYRRTAAAQRNCPASGNTHA